MHVRHCLCIDCVRIATADDEDARVCLNAARAAVAEKPAVIVRLSEGLVRRRAAA
jgi:hypothetical protein